MSAPTHASQHRQGGVAGPCSLRVLLLFTVGLAFVAGCSTVTPPAATADAPPAAPREFRAAWVSTVANIDWPSRRDLTVAQQRAEIIAIVERARALNLNALVLQVRPSADAIYVSRLEPWSEFLTGMQGRAPEPYYDPLRVWIDEAHRRGLQLHAWLNPYRARHSAARSELARNHIAKSRPEAVKSYGNMLWMDPGEPAAVRQTLAVVRDIVSRYDVDGIHVDDYFYPYPEPNLDFPDDPSWNRYQAQGGKLSRADWRRSNVDTLIAEMYRSVHAIKPWVQVGVSPFGLGRPDRRPAGITGFSQFDALYADVERWLEHGWLDYLVPQLYWSIDQPAQAFPVLFDYWSGQNAHRRHMWPGLFTSAVAGPPRNWRSDEIVRQVELTRTRSPDGMSEGQVHFSMKALMEDRGGVMTALQAGPYREPALVPRTPWLGTTAPHAPRLSRTSSDASVAVHPSFLGSRAATFAVWKRFGTTWRFTAQPAAEHSIDTRAHPELGPVDAIVVSAVDRLGNESPRTALTVGKSTQARTVAAAANR